MYREKHYDYSSVEGKWFKDELKNVAFIMQRFLVCRQTFFG